MCLSANNKCKMAGSRQRGKFGLYDGSNAVTDIKTTLSKS